MRGDLRSGGVDKFFSGVDVNKFFSGGVDINKFSNGGVDVNKFSNGGVDINKFFNGGGRGGLQGCRDGGGDRRQLWRTT